MAMEWLAEQQKIHQNTIHLHVQLQSGRKTRTNPPGFKLTFYLLSKFFSLEKNGDFEPLSAWNYMGVSQK